MIAPASANVIGKLAHGIADDMLTTMMQSRADAQESEVRTFIKEIRRYAAIEELDESVLNRLISKILIGEIKKVDGQKVQEVRIGYNFVGEIPEIAA